MARNERSVKNHRVRETGLHEESEVASEEEGGVANVARMG